MSQSNDNLLRQAEQIAANAERASRHMGDRSAVYHEQVAPIVQQLLDLASMHGLPCILVFQTSDGGYELSGNLPRYANDEMRQNWQWWLPEGKILRGESDE